MDGMFLVVDWIRAACVLDVIFVDILDKISKHIFFSKLAVAIISWLTLSELNSCCLNHISFLLSKMFRCGILIFEIPLNHQNQLLHIKQQIQSISIVSKFQASTTDLPPVVIPSFVPPHLTVTHQWIA